MNRFKYISFVLLTDSAAFVFGLRYCERFPILQVRFSDSVLHLRHRLASCRDKRWAKVLGAEDSEVVSVDVDGFAAISASDRHKRFLLFRDRRVRLALHGIGPFDSVLRASVVFANRGALFTVSLSYHA